MQTSSDQPDSVPSASSAEDVSVLAWVQDELRRSLELAHQALRRLLRDTDSTQALLGDEADPSLPRTARQYLHQGVGALELVGLPEAAIVLRASEAAVTRCTMGGRVPDHTAVEAIERASFAVLDYLSRRIGRRQPSAMSLFPAYQAVAELAGQDRVHPADLWTQGFAWRELKPEPGVRPRLPNNDTRRRFESQLLAVLKGESRGAQTRLSDLCSELAAGAGSGTAATLWQLAAAFFEAQTQGALPADTYTKRIASRLLAQLRSLERGDATVSERLAQDLLFFCRQANPDAAQAPTPRLRAVQQGYQLPQQPPTSYLVSPLGRFDPSWLVQARKRVAVAKDSWSAVAGGDLVRAPTLAEQFLLVGDSLRRLYPRGGLLAEALQQAAGRSVVNGQVPAPALAMEVATALLYVDASLEDGELDHPELGDRIEHLAKRVVDVATGGDPEPLVPWMEHLYQQVSSRQTMGSVVQELRASLAEVEKGIDENFRDAGKRTGLLNVPARLGAMRGVLAVLGIEAADRALVDMRDDVEQLIALPSEWSGTGSTSQHSPAQAARFARLAGNLGALSFLIDLLSVQPQSARSLFAYDPTSRTLNAVGGRQQAHAVGGSMLGGDSTEPQHVAQAVALAGAAQSPDVTLDAVSRGLDQLSSAAQTDDSAALAASVTKAKAALADARQAEAAGAEEAAPARERIAEALNDFVQSASAPLDAFDPLDAGPTSPPPAAPRAGPASSLLSQDEEMRGIFIEEAREVLGEIEAAQMQLLTTPDDVSLVTTIRRGFHTLKGSSRMVALREFGEAAWICEQVFNSHLAGQRAADEDLLAFTGYSVSQLTPWVDAIEAGEDSPYRAAPMQWAAEALKGGRPMPASPPGVLPTLDADARDGMAAPLSSAPASVTDKPVTRVSPLAAALSDFGLPLDLPSAADLDLSASAASVAAADLSLPVLTDVQDVTTLPAGGADAAPLLTEVVDRSASDEPAAALGIDGGAEVEITSASAAGHPVARDEASETPLPDLTAAMNGLTVESLPALDAAQLAAAAEAGEALPTLPDVPEVTERGPHEPEADDELVDEYKHIGPLRVPVPLFNIYLNEAEELSRRLTTETHAWVTELHRPIGESTVALAHSLGGSSATVGYRELSALARQLEVVLNRSQALGCGEPPEAFLFVEAADDIRGLLHQFAAGFLQAPRPELVSALAAMEQTLAERLQAQLPSGPSALGELSGAGGQHGLAATGSPDGWGMQPGQPASRDAAESADAASAASAASAAVGFGAMAATPRAARDHLPMRPDVVPLDEDLDAVDAVDADLFPIFDEEASELLPRLAEHLREWRHHPGEPAAATAALRDLHTFKGGARLAGAMRLGEMAHRLEADIEHLLSRPVVASDVEVLQVRADGLQQQLETLRLADRNLAGGDAADEPHAPVGLGGLTSATVAEDAPAATTGEAPAMPAAADPWPGQAANDEGLRSPEVPTTAVVLPMVAPTAASAPAADPPQPLAEPDWSRFVAAADALGIDPAGPADARTVLGASSSVRVRTPMLERMVGLSGEVAVTRSRIESGVQAIRGSLGDLGENLVRMRDQLRAIELQAESQMASRREAQRVSSQAFDPLEFDRFTRLQELTRMMAESVNDVGTVQRNLQRSVEAAEDELAAQARLTRDLQDDLLRTRMVEFEGLSERLYRVVRQAAKETGKLVSLEILGGTIEVDRGVLDRMTPAFEHLLRNAVTHGVELPAVRAALGKPDIGRIVVALTQEGNDVRVEFSDDGAGLDMPRIRERAVAMGLLDSNDEPSEAALAAVIFTPGFSTAETVTGLAGRGIGMDVVRSEVDALGGRVETQTKAGEGTLFRLLLPLTTAVTQVVMLRCGDDRVAVPATLVEIVRRVDLGELERAYSEGEMLVGDQRVPFHWFGSLLQMSAAGREAGVGRTRPVVVIRSAQQRIVVHVDEVLGTQEVVVKNLGPQLSRLPGLGGMTLLASGAVALIYNPVALATAYGDRARAATVAARRGEGSFDLRRADEAPGAASTAAIAPLVLVVDDSLTVRRVTQRLLVREGYRVALAKDGLEALERVAEERPAVVLSDIEMPRMDGFDLVRNLRGDDALRGLPVIMITSRIAQKHRDYAAELGVDHYLGKPYGEDDLLALVSRYARVLAA